MKDVRPYGSWASPVSSARLTEGAVALSDLRVFDGRPYWLESPPAGGRPPAALAIARAGAGPAGAGRLVVMTYGSEGVRQLTPDGFNARTRVHEYGGAPYAAGPEGL